MPCVLGQARYLRPRLAVGEIDMYQNDTEGMVALVKEDAGLPSEVDWIANEGVPQCPVPCYRIGAQDCGRATTAAAE